MDKHAKIATSFYVFPTIIIRHQLPFFLKIEGSYKNLQI